MSDTSPSLKRFLLLGGITVAVIFTVTWGTARLLTWLLPDDKPTQATKVYPYPSRHVTPLPARTFKVPTRRHSAKKKASKRAPAPRRWVGKKPNLPSHEELMKRVKAQRTYPRNLPPIPKPGSKHYNLSRDKFKQWLELPLAQSGARFIPNFRGNRPTGIKVTTVTPGSFYERLGLYKGDVLLKVNGREVLSPGHAHKFYKQIAKRYRNLTMTIKRGGKRHIVDFSLR